jgi:hypothetical protein
MTDNIKDNYIFVECIDDLKKIFNEHKNPRITKTTKTICDCSTELIKTDICAPEHCHIIHEDLLNIIETIFKNKEQILSWKKDSEKWQIINKTESIQTVIETNLILEQKVKQLDEDVDLERNKKGKYTKYDGGHRSNSCEFEIHGIECEHGDCDCNCHEDDSKYMEK